MRNETLLRFYPIPYKPGGTNRTRVNMEFHDASLFEITANVPLLPGFSDPQPKFLVVIPLPLCGDDNPFDDSGKAKGGSVRLGCGGLPVVTAAQAIVCQMIPNADRAGDFAFL